MLLSFNVTRRRLRVDSKQSTRSAFGVYIKALLQLTLRHLGKAPAPSVILKLRFNVTWRRLRKACKQAFRSAHSVIIKASL